jgi:hypothetical protein
LYLEMMHLICMDYELYGDICIMSCMELYV